MILQKDDLRIKDNLYVRTKRNGVVQDERVKHNVFLYLGRAWLAKMIGCTGYPAGSVANMRDTDIPTSRSLESSWVTPPPASVERTYRVRYVGVGVGGLLQTVTPPGQGGYAELPTINAMEAPCIVGTSALSTTEMWMGEVQPQTTAAPPAGNISLDGNTITFYKLFTETEISFVHASNPYGTSVPVTEVGLFTSAADPFYAPLNSNFGGGDVPGMIAYGLMDPIHKTPNVELEVIWEITFA